MNFKSPTYVGDPINAVRIFNEKEADELVVFDIDATVSRTEPDYVLIANLANECRMPLCYGGGVTRAEQAQRIIGLGVEKVAVSAAALSNPAIISEMAAAIGKQSVVVVFDLKKHRFGSGYDILTHNGTRSVKGDPLKLATRMAELGAGEIVFNSIDRDGTMSGFDISLAKQLRQCVDVPISICGGAGSLDDIAVLLEAVGVVGVIAGSLFVFKGQYRAVLINYPRPQAKDDFVRASIKTRARDH